MKKYFFVTLFFVIGCGKHPLAPTDNNTKLNSPANKSIVRTTQPTFEWSSIDGAIVYHLIVYNQMDTVINFKTALRNYTAYEFMLPDKYYWKVFYSKDGFNFNNNSNEYEFSLIPMPFSIKSVTQTPATVYDFISHNNLIYSAGNEAGIIIYENHLPDSISLLSQIPTEDKAKAFDIDTISNYMFLADYRGNVKLYDISNPYNPIFLNSQFARRCLDVKSLWRNDTLYIFVADEDNGVMVFSIETGGYFLQRGDVTVVGGYCNTIEIKDTILIVGAEELGIKIFDTVHPDSLRLISTFDLPGTVEDIERDGNILYIALGLSGIAKVDISNPINPIILNIYNPQLGNANKVKIMGDYIIASMGSEGIFIFNKSLSFIQQLDTPYSYSVLPINDNILFGDRDWGIGIIGMQWLM